MEKRALFAALLSLGVLFLWQIVFPPPKRDVTQPLPSQESTAEPSDTSAVAGGASGEKAEKDKEGPPSAAGTLLAEEAQAAKAEARKVVVETQLFTATLLSRGGTIGDWELKQHRTADGEPVNLATPELGVPPLSVRFFGSQPDWADHVVFGTDAPDRIVLGAGNETATVTFRAEGPDGFAVAKSLTFHHDSYRVDLRVETRGAEAFRLALGSNFGVFGQTSGASRYSGHIGPLYSTGTKREEVKPKKVSGEEFIKDQVQWVAQEDSYFAAVIAPVNAEVDGAVIWKSAEERAEIAYRVKGTSGEFLLYAGPKEYDRLKALGGRLVDVIDFGFFSFIAIPLFWLMRSLYGMVNNYGLAIILISVIIKVPFIPLMNKSQASMKKMQEIQPKLKEMQEKYKKDPDKLRKETMEIYRSNKVSPLGGCLPMFLQIPVFFALYKVLLVSIELRGAPFFGWITDLSAKDPYWVLPLLMGATMFLQQKLTPSSMDPKQAKIMQFMPVIFTFMFLNLPSGLVLYWTVTNIFSIFQQLYVNKKTSSKAVAAS